MVLILLQARWCQDSSAKEANWMNVNLEDADLKYIDLHEENLENTELQNANLQDTNLEYANLEGTIFYKYNSSIDIDLLIDEKTKWYSRILVGSKRTNNRR